MTVVAKLAIVGACLFAAVVGLSACSTDGDADGAQVVEVSITSEGCSPEHVESEAGRTTFVVTNKGATGVTEYEILDGDRIVGEAEHIASGLQGRFTITLEPGEYTTYCPGGTSVERGTLTVIGESSASE